MEEKKKMSLMQLTFIVAVNMMGSGIIMLPTNMAQVGAISLLSWVVTAVGSMAIAYGFAQAGIFNQRSGGMAAYAEDAYGRAGYFQVFLLYFLSLAIGNVAIGISAVGYLSTFFPWLSSTPISTCITVIALLWLTTFANFGGPSITGRIGAITVWGVIIPVGMISIIGWFWFSADTFAAAWNPQGMSLAQGMGSSISLTLWAFLGMESAAQNSAAVENPKRDVPLACMFGTLGAAVIYVLSTTVIQGIVPNAELANSTGPFGLAYAKMFSPLVGSVIMALAVMACLGSLLGWQFTIAQTGKAAAEERMFPALFSKVNRMGAPVTGMLVLGVVQSLLALSTISPTLSEQFSALVNLAVVTNVIPYIVALSALVIMMKNAHVSKDTFRRNVAVALVAMGYSVFAIYASGKDAVLGGMLVLGITYVIWGFIAPRFAASATAPAREEHPKKGFSPGVATATPRVSGTLALAIVCFLCAAPLATSAQVLDRIKETGSIKFGYVTDGRPFAFRNEAGDAEGYVIELCRRIAEQAAAQAGLPNLAVEWVPLGADARTRAVREGGVDLMCTPAVPTLARRKEVSFSIPVFAGGNRAVIRTDTSESLRTALQGTPSTQPVWRGSPAAKVLQRTIFAVVSGTTSESWLTARKAMFQIDAEVLDVEDYRSGLEKLLDHRVDVLFGDRAVLLGAMSETAHERLVILDRLFTQEVYALPLPHDDEDFRLLVDGALSELYASDGFGDLYARWYGEFDDDTRAFFLWNTFPEHTQGMTSSNRQSGLEMQFAHSVRVAEE